MADGRATSNRVRGSRAASYEGLFAMIEPLGDFQHDIRLYDTEDWKRLPQHQQAVLDGVIARRLDAARARVVQDHEETR